MKTAQRPRTIQDFCSELKRKNVTLADWSRDNKFPIGTVYALTRGLATGRSGTARQVLEAMGVEPPALRRHETA